MSVRSPVGGDPRQAAFNFFLPSQNEKPLPTTPAKTTPDDFDQTMRGLIGSTLDECGRRAVAPMDRERVAALISAHLGRRVSKTQLDQWSAPSQGDRRIHADALRALCLVTGDWRTFHFFVGSCGFKALTPKEAVCAEFGALHAVRRHLDHQARALAGPMEDMVGELVGLMRREAL